MILTESGVAFIETANLYPEESRGNTYTEHDVYLLAHLIAGEAQPCDDMEQRYVASVVLNRVTDSRFPNSLEGVIFRKDNTPVFQMVISTELRPSGTG